MRRTMLGLALAAIAVACSGGGSGSVLVAFIEASGSLDPDHPQFLTALNHHERVAYNGNAVGDGNWAEVIIRDPGRVVFRLIPQPPGDGYWNVCAEIDTPTGEADSPACSVRDQVWETLIETPDAVLLVHVRVFQADQLQPYILEIESLP